MIIGNGLLANAFRNTSFENSKICIFASGVSNSREISEAEFLREKNMLIEYAESGTPLIYFSTCSIMDPELFNSAYVQHKKMMETIVSKTDKYAIFRLPQVVGKTKNLHTLTNFIYKKVSSGQTFEVWKNARRNLIDVSDVALVVDSFIKNGNFNKSTENIAAPSSTSILQLVNIFEEILQKKAVCTISDVGGSYSIDAEFTVAMAGYADINFGANYVERLIKKYYGT